MGQGSVTMSTNFFHHLGVALAADAEIAAATAHQTGDVFGSNALAQVADGVVLLIGMEMSKVQMASASAAADFLAPINALGRVVSDPVWAGCVSYSFLRQVLP